MEKVYKEWMQPECPCPKNTCPNHGDCKKCVVKHKVTDSLPYCLFMDNEGNKSNHNHYLKLKERFEEDIHIRNACYDLNKVRGLFMEYLQEQGKEAESENMQEEDLFCPKGVIYLAYHKEQEIGFIALSLMPDIQYRLECLYVRPEFRGRGIGKALVEKCRKLYGESTPGTDRT